MRREDQCLVVESFTAALETLPESISPKLLFSSQSELQLVSTCRKPPTSTQLGRLHLDDSPSLSDGSIGIELSPVESFVDLRGSLNVLQRKLSGCQAEVDELEKGHSESEKREEEIQKRKAEWQNGRRKRNGFKKELEMLRKEEEVKHREGEEGRIHEVRRRREDEVELLEETRKNLQQVQILQGLNEKQRRNRCKKSRR